MWNKKLLFCIAFLPLLHVTRGYGEECDIESVKIEPLTSQTFYEVASPGVNAMILSYLLRPLIRNQSCNAYIYVQLENGNTWLEGVEADGLHFQWFSRRGNLQGAYWAIPISDTSPDTVIEMRFPAGQWVRAGQYNGALLISTQGASGKFTSALQSVLAVVLPSAQIQYYGMSEREYTLQLGELKSARVINDAPRLWVQTNTDYVIEITSKNQGALRHIANGQNWDIPYQMFLGSMPVDLRQALARQYFNSSVKGTVLNMMFTLGKVINKPGGQYEDNLTLSITPDLSQSGK